MRATLEAQMWERVEEAERRRALDSYRGFRIPLRVSRRVDESEALPELQLMCNDVPLDREMSLATAYSFVWKTPGEDMQLQYCRAQGEAEA